MQKKHKQAKKQQLRTIGRPDIQLEPPQYSDVPIPRDVILDKDTSSLMIFVCLRNAFDCGLFNLFLTVFESDYFISGSLFCANVLFQYFADAFAQNPIQGSLKSRHETVQSWSCSSSERYLFKFARVFNFLVPFCVW